MSFILPDCRTVRFFSKVPGDIQNHIKDLKSYLNVPHFTEVSSTDWCDVILNFCPVDSDSDSASRIQEVIKEIPGITHKEMPQVFFCLH